MTISSPPRTTTSPVMNLRAHFHLNTTPFTREVTVERCWVSPTHEQILSDLMATVEQRMSAALIAPAGTGKTTLLRRLQALLAEARYRLHYVKVTSLSKRDFCRELSVAIGARPAGTYATLVRRIQERMLGLLEQDSLRPVLVIDEAHDMRPDVLAVLRVLTNFEMDSRLVISVLLAGQMPLKTMLKRDELESVRRRLAHVATMRLLSREETVSYVQHRLDISGGSTDIFDPLAHDAIYEMTQGNLRAIDRVCLKAMESAARAGEPTIGAQRLSEAGRSLLL